jgi:4-amino-4-deoxy-L-arabinose transferase-like glycosyltransferase
LGGQASWLLPLALLGFFVAAWQIRLRWPLDRRHQALLLWLGWLLPQAVFFSVANLFHRYYLEMLSPAIAALVGAGAAALWNDYRGPQRRGWLLPAALVGSAAVEVALLSAFPDWSRWLSPLVAGLCLAAAATLVVARLFSQARTTRPVWAGVAATVAVLALLLPPTVWTLIPVWSGGDTALPYAGPDLLAQPRRGGLPETDQLVAYLTANRGDETFLAAAINANTAAPLMLETGEAVMALGGFSGSDPILTADELAERVAGGAVRFFLIPPDGGQQRELTRWVTENCRPVAPELWRPGGPGVGGEPGGLPALFDCGR